MDLTTTSTVSYRPYKSKRHSRTISGEAAASSNAEPAAHGDHPHPSHNGIAPRSRPASVALTNGHVGAAPPSASASQLMRQSDPVAPSPLQPPSFSRPPTPLSSSSKTLTPSPSALALTPPLSRTSTQTPTPSFSKASVPAPTPSSSKTPAPTPSSSTLGQPKPPTSTFRRLAAPSQSSPLRPTLTSTPAHVTRRRRFDTQVQSQPQPPPAFTRASSGASSPIIPTIALSSPTPGPSVAAAWPSPTPQSTPAASNPQISRSSTPTPTTAPTPRPSSTASTPSSRHSSAPYRPGFQPKGVYRPLTDEFLAARAAVRDCDKAERHRLERRLEKLIALHFPREFPAEKPKPQVARRSSLLEFSKNPAELWRDVMQRPKPDIRAEEQSITPWQEDSTVSHCPLCSASFHPLTNRKHHCRLCGRIICARIAVQTCSLLFVVDQKSGAIEEVREGVDYGVRRKREEEKFLRGVRVCRECRVVLLRQQYLQEAEGVPTYVRLYSTLISLEKEIEDALLPFRELILSLSADSPSAMHASAAALRTRVLASFKEYDRLAQRIRDLPAARGSGQARVQGAVASRANNFLQKNMVTLQELPKQGTKDQEGGVLRLEVDRDSALAHALQPLLEQEALLETFVEEAQAQRKFEDARTLKANLEEIRVEIERVSKGGGIGVGVNLGVGDHKSVS